MALEEHDPLTPLIDAYMIERIRSPRRLEAVTLDLVDRPRPGGRLSPSSVAGCQRQAVFKFAGVEVKNRTDPDFELLMEEGKWHHHKWQTRFADMQIVLGKDRFKLISIEQAVQIPELYVAGSSDALVRINGKKWVIDFKSINTFGFNYVYQNHAPKEEHVKQVLSYCVAHGIKRGMLLYDHKDSKDYKVFTIKFSEESWHDVEKWCKAVIHKIKRQQLPAKHPDCSRGSFLFEKCPFAPLCFSEKYNEAKLRRMAFDNFVGIDEAWEEGMRAA